MSTGVGKRQVRGTIAKICGITPQAVQQWFSGSTVSPSAENLAAVAAEFDGNLMWIITGKGAMKTPGAERPLSDIELLWVQLPAAKKAKFLKLIQQEVPP